MDEHKNMPPKYSRALKQLAIYFNVYEKAQNESAEIDFIRGFDDKSFMKEYSYKELMPYFP